MLLLEHSCDIRRNQPAGTNGRMQPGDFAAGVACLFLPMSPTAAVQNGFSVSKAFDVYFNSGTDVKVGDKLGRDTRSYTVRGVQSYETAFGAHVHVIAERQEAN